MPTRKMTAKRATGARRATGAKKPTATQNAAADKKPVSRKMVRPESVERYLANLPPDQRRVLEKLRAQIKAIAPGAVESVSYGVPTFKLDGKPLIYFSAWANHLSVYGVPVDGPELRNYSTAKGTIRFGVEKPLPAALVTKLVKKRIANIRRGAGGY